MAQPAPSEDWPRFLAELHGFFEACGPDIDAALASHFGEDTAVDWITASLELFTEHLTGQPFNPAPTSENSGVTT
ncbi:hypothetical protein JHN59_30790 [Streptomyces sp. MBT49]|uniref:hypothetical protein n=1 Tax=unclassified Streptomyces TaxID=2593676 RepID=UPI00190D6172|nr:MULTISPECIES: hypothetical protein [unclassified Streptomyces]MBK3629132.1 hypothetical protein [Streptomyces sp. MBT49]MBK3643953.1 hypothetical protein [Streptomyces sp. MBT33]